MIIIITNYQDIIDLTAKINTNNIKIRVIYFNPWGFSSSGIKGQILEALKFFEYSDQMKIIFCMKNLFFGRRLQIAISEIKLHWQNSQILKVDREEFESFFDNLSI
jgi:hypothetical protein